MGSQMQANLTQILPIALVVPSNFFKCFLIKEIIDLK